MSRKVKLSVIITVCILAALALVYGIAGFVCIYKESCSEKEDMPFFEKCSAALGEMMSENTSGDIFRKICYSITGNVSSDGITSSNGFLFPVKTESFDYEADFKGEYGYSPEECAQIKDILQNRAEKYENAGSEYYIFIIPNLQSVYSDKTPFDGEISSSTRAKALVQYLSENSDVNVYFPIDELAQYAKEQCIYNNTENSVNEIGAYRMFETIKAKMPQGLRVSGVDFGKYGIACEKTLGRGLAEKLNMQKTIRNDTYYFSDLDFEDFYSVKGQNGGHTVTSLKTLAGKASVVLQVPNAHERSLLKGFFSATYSNVTVCDSHIFCEYSFEDGTPNAVVQIIREDELDSIFDEAVKLSYDMSQSEKSPSAEPTIDARFTIERGYITVVGKAKSGDTVRAVCGRNKASTTCVDGFYMVTVKAENNSKVAITATSKGKGASKAVYTDANVQVNKSNMVTLGTASRMFFNDTLSDFIRDNAYEARQLVYLKKNVQNELKKIRNATGKDTQMIILCAPNPATIYGQNEMPDSILRKVRDKESCLESLNRELGKIDGVTTVDITQVMKDNAEDSKLYYLTDTHWTELGAYYGYCGIVNAVGKTSKGVAPYSPDQLKMTTTVSPGGDMAEFLGIERRITENTPHLSVLGESRLVTKYNKPDTIKRDEASGDFVTEANDSTLPTAYMMRDSYSMQMIPLIGEHFSKLYYEEMWNYEPDISVLEDLKPDYVIYVITERNANVVFM